MKKIPQGAVKTDLTPAQVTCVVIASTWLLALVLITVGVLLTLWHWQVLPVYVLFAWNFWGYMTKARPEHESDKTPPPPSV